MGGGVGAGAKWVVGGVGAESLLGTSGIYLGTYSLGLFAGLFSDTMGYC